MTSKYARRSSPPGRPPRGPRKQGRPATSAVDYGEEELEFFRAIERWKGETHRQFPTNRELLGILKALGYARPLP